ncbi:hypothetical protein DL96DRAFT_1590940 [Flagelloscypha sp. PMI_526]|nr:hypothetical protein DL96DRAFT_1590940 [Flagelloscypha sp. PMI_526]
MLSSKQRDTSFYLEDILAIFEVEETLFRVPLRKFLRYSPVFRGMLECTPEEGKEGEGQKDENPICLPDSREDFTALMKYFYPDVVGGPTTSNEWISILHLSHKYEMDEVHHEAHETLSIHFDLEPLLKFTLASRYNLPSTWTDEAVISLCRRPEGLSMEEAELVGLRYVVAIGRVREYERERELELRRKVKRPVVTELGDEKVLKMVENVMIGKRLLEDVFQAQGLGLGGVDAGPFSFGSRDSVMY